MITFNQRRERQNTRAQVIQSFAYRTAHRGMLSFVLATFIHLLCGEERLSIYTIAVSSSQTDKLRAAFLGDLALTWPFRSGIPCYA